MIPFSTVNNILMLVKSSNCTFDFIKAACHDNPNEEKNKQGRVYIFQDTLLESFQIHQLALMYGFEGRNRCIHSGLLLQILSKLLFRACSLH